MCRTVTCYAISGDVLCGSNILSGCVKEWQTLWHHQRWSNFRLQRLKPKKTGTFLAERHDTRRQLLILAQQVSSTIHAKLCQQVKSFNGLTSLLLLQEGLRVLKENGLVFKCYERLYDTVWNSELGSSAAIFNAGYTIDSLMLKYQGADWLNRANWKCNDG